MTRGKYAARAEIRRDAAEVQASEEAYRRQIVRLTQERDEARAERDEARKLWKREVRVLQGQVREGTSGRVEALIHEVERMRSARDEAAREVKAIRDTWDRALRRLHEALVEKCGMSFAEALEWSFARAIHPPGRYRGQLAVEPDETVDEFIEAVAQDPTHEGEPVIAFGVSEGPNQRQKIERFGVDAVVAIQKARGIR